MPCPHPRVVHNRRVRISARWSSVPLAITVAGVVYLSLVKLANFEAALKEPQVVSAPPKPFIPPPVPVKRGVADMPPPPELNANPVRPMPPDIPGIQLPPFGAKARP